MIALMVVLWACVFLVVWSQIGYVAFLLLVASFSKRQLRQAPIEPSVTVIVAAHNEEQVIADKVRDTLSLDYPEGKLEVIVAADGCSDGTCAAVEALQEPRVRVIDLPGRNGKTAAQNAGAAAASGEILVFTDATTVLPADSVRGLVAHFADERVGCVGGELEYVSRGGTAVGVGGGAYWKYEKTIKRLESQVSSLIGVSGCLYAVRASAYRPIEPDLISDFVIAIDIASQRMVTAYAEGVVAREETHEQTGREFQMRVRVAIRSINALVHRRRMLNPLRHGFFAIQLLSHKVLRYLTPVLLLAILLASAALVALAAGPLYVALLAAQIFVYAAGAAQYLMLKVGLKSRPFYVPFYFLHANVAALRALIAYAGGERAITWTPVR